MCTSWHLRFLLFRPQPDVPAGSVLQIWTAIREAATRREDETRLRLLATTGVVGGAGEQAPQPQDLPNGQLEIDPSDAGEPSTANMPPDEVIPHPPTTSDGSSYHPTQSGGQPSSMEGHFSPNQHALPNSAPGSLSPNSSSDPLEGSDGSSTDSSHDPPDIDHIPSEILLSIVRDAVRPPSTGAAGVDPDDLARDELEAALFINLIRLSHVSRHWWRIITQASQLWSTIVPSSSTHLVEAWIMRSGTSRLRIKINYQNFSPSAEIRVQEEAQWLEALAEHSSRWQTLHFKHVPAAGHLLRQWLYHPTPLLRTFLIDDIASYLGSLSQTDGGLFGGEQPILARFTLAGLQVPLRQVDGSRITHLYLDKTLCPLTEVVTLLRATALLKAFRLEYTPLNPASATPGSTRRALEEDERNWNVASTARFELACLHDIELTMEWRHANTLLSAFTAPNLRQLTYHSYGPHTVDMFRPIVQAAEPALALFHDTPGFITTALRTRKSTVYFEPYNDSPTSNEPIIFVVGLGRCWNADIDRTGIASSYGALLDAMPPAILGAMKLYQHASIPSISSPALLSTSSRCPNISIIHTQWPSNAPDLLTKTEAGEDLFPNLHTFAMERDPENLHENSPTWMADFDVHRGVVHTHFWEVDA